jgi:3',5'-cyclic AMP phosphodiesterase CpdA
VSKKLVICSDTHELHSHLSWPEGDILVHAGDFTMIGRPDKIEEFGYWLRDSPFSAIVIILVIMIFYFRKSLKKQKSCCQNMTRFTTLRTLNAESMASHFMVHHGRPTLVLDGHSLSMQRKN